MSAVTPPPQAFAPQAFAPRSIYDAPPPLPVTAASAATPAVAVIAAASVTEQPRRYSLHRDYGEQPDRAVIPAPVYLDHLPVNVADKVDKASKQAKKDAGASGDDGDVSDGGAT
jgi:hypothetical protein